MSFGSPGSSSSEGTPFIYTYKDIMPQWQQAMREQMAPSMLESALGQGFTSTEMANKMGQANANISRATQTAGDTLKQQYANTGIRGGALADALGGLQEQKIQAAGQAGVDIGNQAQAQKNQNMSNWMNYLNWQYPYAAGTTTSGASSGGWNIGI